MRCHPCQGGELASIPHPQFRQARRQHRRLGRLDRRVSGLEAQLLPPPHQQLAAYQTGDRGRGELPFGGIPGQHRRIDRIGRLQLAQTAGTGRHPLRGDHRPREPGIRQAPPHRVMKGSGRFQHQILSSPQSGSWEGIGTACVSIRGQTLGTVRGQRCPSPVGHIPGSGPTGRSSQAQPHHGGRECLAPTYKPHPLWPPGYSECPSISAYGRFAAVRRGTHNEG